MAPVATNEHTEGSDTTNGTAKGAIKAVAATKLFNPFYSPTVAGDGDDTGYKYAKYKVRHDAPLS